MVAFSQTLQETYNYAVELGREIQLTRDSYHVYDDRDRDLYNEFDAILGEARSIVDFTETMSTHNQWLRATVLIQELYDRYEDMKENAQERVREGQTGYESQSEDNFLFE